MPFSVYFEVETMKKTLKISALLLIFVLGISLVFSSCDKIFPTGGDEYSTEGLKHVNCNKMFCSCDGFDIEVGVTTATVEEARITASMMDAASEVILLVDSTKIGKSTYGKICDVNRIDTIITDSGIQQSVVDRLEDAGIQVVIVG